MTEKGDEATSDDGLKDRLVAAADRIRASRTLDKSVYLNRLFDFLIVRTLAGEPPKEVEIAHEVYHIPFGSEAGQDATVRVGVHRLRRKLEDFPTDGLTERLLLPRGGYGLVLEAIDRETVSSPDPTNAVEAEDRPRSATARYRWMLVGAVAALVACLALFAILRTPAVPQDPRIASALWSPLTRTPLPTVVVVGDHYVAGQTNARGQIIRLIQMPDIVSQPTLETYNAREKGANDRLIDLNYYESPAATAPALAAILPLVDAAVVRGSGSVETVPNSRLPTDAMSGRNIVYVGLLSGLRDLSDPIFEASGFAMSPSGDALIDRASGHHFQSNWSNPSDDRVLARDYAYLASVPGPSGSRMIVVAGTRDPALAEAAQIASNNAKLATLGARVGGAAAFEALYEVRTFGPSNYASRLIVARPMRVQHNW